MIELGAVIAIEGQPLAGDPFAVWSREAIQGLAQDEGLDRKDKIIVRERDDGLLEAVAVKTVTVRGKSDG